MSSGKKSNLIALRSKTWLFWVLPGIARGASWGCSFVRRGILPTPVVPHAALASVSRLRSPQQSRPS